MSASHLYRDQPPSFYASACCQALQPGSSPVSFDEPSIYGFHAELWQKMSDGSMSINENRHHSTRPVESEFASYGLACNSTRWMEPTREMEYGISIQDESQDSTTYITVSTAFHPTAHPHLPTPDTILVSVENVIFYVHSSVILRTCKSAFKDFLGSRLDDPRFRHTPVGINAPSAELNVLLHLLYENSPAAHSPTYEVLENTVNLMPRYSISPRKYIRPASPLYTLLLALSPLHPLGVYVLAAQHKIHDLAVAASSHLLSYSLLDITDEQAQRMGTIYFKKLVNLHLTRSSCLKSILLNLPVPHPPTRQCGFPEQKKLTRAWALASAYILWDSRLDFSTYTLQSSLNPLLDDLECSLCKQSLQNRIKDIITRWTLVEHTI